MIDLADFGEEGWHGIKIRIGRLKINKLCPKQKPR
jgi:hypothetical protein